MQIIKIKIVLITLLALIVNETFGQLVINEGCNKNYSTISDEDGDFEDWIEIYNSGATAIDLFNYSLSDNSNPGEWVFPHQVIQPNQFILVFCSEKDRFSSSPFTNVLTDSTFTPQAGWNTHHFSTPFYWDGVSNIVLNLCTYNPFYQCNSIHSQSATTYNSATIALNYPGSACGFNGGSNAQQRPNIRFNSTTVGTGTLQNGYTDYPSAYSNWYEGARQQYLYTASELISAGLSAGNIDSLAFDVIATCPTNFQLFELSLANTGINSLPPNFIPATGNFNHTNFKISSTGETIKLYDPSGVLTSMLTVNCGPGYDVSVGHFTDASTTITKFNQPTPGASNNTSTPLNSYAAAPMFSVISGIYTAPISVSIFDLNLPASTIYYTLDGSEPDTASILWTGNDIVVSQSTLLRARAYLDDYIPSTITSASYLFNVNHTTPILSVISDSVNLFGPTGMFDNPTLDLLKAASVDYFDSTPDHNLLFSRKVGIIMDGGWGSRGNPQRPFRIKLDDGVLGEGPVMEPLLPDRPTRNQYSDFYLFNGGGNYMVLPFKDAVQVKMMGAGTNSYYAASRPVTVYINGDYWGVYDMKEKFNTEMFELYDGAIENTIDILGSSANYGFQLRAIEGNVDPFFEANDSISQINPLDSNFWTQADQYVDMIYYNDYIIAELWMNNVDWGANYNNLKIYRSNASNYRWRYCLMDLEYGLLPNHGWINGANNYDCNFDLLGGYINHQTVDPGNPHFNVFWRGLQNDRFRNYFINRFADQMNTVYLPARLLAIEDAMYNLTLPEMPAHFARWGDPNNVPAHMNGYLQYHQLFSDELACRPDNMRNQIQSNFNLPQQVQVELDVFPSNGGKINISTISSDSYPWNGIYFDGVPIQIEALAMPGYQFSHWESNGLITDTLNAVFLDTLTTAAINFKAHFVSTLGIDELKPSVFDIYPNPTSEHLTIKLKENIGKINQLSVYDVLGKEYHLDNKQNGTTEYWINVSSLGPGFYLIKCQTDDSKLYHGEFIKQ
jgi:hypothetical protein